jgi:P4 family phage/plasmid primase-like protien
VITTTTGIEFAKKIDELFDDVPLVTCKPKLGDPKNEFHFPTGERDKLSATDNANQLDKWRPGDGIMARTGGSVAGVDVDPRNGGDIAKMRQLLDGLNVKVFAEALTPSGGWHFYIDGNPELPSAHEIPGWPGVDVLSFGSLVFLPGTQRPKYDGAGYMIIREDLEALADGGDPDGAEAFAGWLADRLAERGGGGDFEPSEPWQGGEPDARQAAYLTKMLNGIHADLAATTKSRNIAAYNSGLKCGNFIAGAGLNEARAIERLLDACYENGLAQEDGELSVEASIKSGIKNGKARPRAVPDAKQSPTNGSTPSSKKLLSGKDDEPTDEQDQDGQPNAGQDQQGEQGAEHQDQQAPTRFFHARSGLLARVLADAVEDGHPMALTREDRLAIYDSGAYRIDGMSLQARVEEVLGNRYRPAHLRTVTDVLEARQKRAGRYLPERLGRPLLNVANGMLNLETGELLSHDPDYLSGVQLPVVWNPDATCPNYEQWAKNQIGDQLDDLEETTSQMLDQSRTPTKAAFAFGPARSGKSTYVRLTAAMVGVHNHAAVTLHQLSQNRFAAAQVYGKILNAAAEISAAHIDDMSIFKLMTGEDLINAERKNQQMFTFRNQAFFVFAANTLPTVSETSSAYRERIKPFKFGNSFAGKEDPTIEEAMLQELPGILVRWVKAWQRRNERGAFLPGDERVRTEFEVNSDRVAAFLVGACEIVDDHNLGSTVSELFDGWQKWADGWQESATGWQISSMRLKTFKEKLYSARGVTEGRRNPNKTRVVNVRLRPGHTWVHDLGDE